MNMNHEMTEVYEEAQELIQTLKNSGIDGNKLKELYENLTLDNATATLGVLKGMYNNLSESSNMTLGMGMLKYSGWVALFGGVAFGLLYLCERSITSYTSKLFRYAKFITGGITLIGIIGIVPRLIENK